MNKFIVVIAGPTAVGKTNVAIDLAKVFNTEIISADARQFYNEMNIGTAKPTPQQLAEVKHHFINTLSITEDYNAGQFELDAMHVLEEIFHQHDIAVIVGGSGFYINALCNGMEDVPQSDPSIRKDLMDRFVAHGIAHLQEELKSNDIVCYNNIDLANPHRIIRALEVIRMTGKPYSSFLNQTKKDRPFKVLKIGLNMERPDLYNRINNRVDAMIDAGLEDEVKSLMEYKDTNAMNTVGYAEWFDYFEGNRPKDLVINYIKQNSRHYAKRQLTWFKRDADMKWFEPQHLEAMILYIRNAIS